MPTPSLPTSTSSAALPPKAVPAPRGASRPADLSALARQASALLREAAEGRRPVDGAAMLDVVAKLGGHGARAVAVLVALLGQVASLRHQPSTHVVADHFEGHCQLAVIHALAAAAAARPLALREAYAQSDVSSVRDSLCEAAAIVPGGGNTLLPLMLTHLQENSFVASLSLAQHGDPRALPSLQAHLRRQVGAVAQGRRSCPTGPHRRSDNNSLQALHIDGLVESIEALGGAIDADLLPAVAKASAAGRATLAPLLALTTLRALPEG